MAKVRYGTLRFKTPCAVLFISTFVCFSEAFLISPLLPSKESNLLRRQTSNIAIAKYGGRSSRIIACSQASQTSTEKSTKDVKIMAKGSNDLIRLFNAQGAKPYASHLASMCQVADTEQRFLNGKELETLISEPDIAAGMRRLLSRFEAEMPSIIEQIFRDLDEVNPSRRSQLSSEEWNRWAHLLQYLLLSVRGDEYESDDLQGVVDMVESLVDKEAAKMYCLMCKAQDLELDMVRSGIRRMTAPYDVGACWAEAKGRKIVYALDCLVRDAWNAAGTVSPPGLRLS